jgi:hypothetical protein
LLALLQDVSLEGDPPSSFTSVCVNVDYAAELHVDGRNAGSSTVLGLGDYEGGALWVADEEGDVAFVVTDEQVTGLSLRPGVFLLGRSYDVRRRWTTVDGAAPHRVEPFSGRRISVVFFTVPGASARQNTVLRALGFPGHSALPYTVCVCRSRRSAGLATATLAFLRREGLGPQHLLICLRDAEDADAYDYLGGARVILSPRPADGLPAQRDACLRSAPPGSWLLFLDDDVEDLRALPAPDGTRVSLHDVAMHGFLEAERGGAHLWGLNCSADPRNLAPSVSDRPGLVCGYFFGVILASDLPILRYSDAVGGAAEDVERSVRFYCHSGLRRLMFAQALAKTWTNDGGLQSFFRTREIRVAAHDYVARCLERDFPDVLRYEAERPLRCRFLSPQLPRSDATPAPEGLARPTPECRRLARERTQERCRRVRERTTTTHACPTCSRIFKRKKDLLPHIRLGRCFSSRGRHRPTYNVENTN